MIFGTGSTLRSGRLMAHATVKVPDIDLHMTQSHEHDDMSTGIREPL